MKHVFIAAFAALCLNLFAANFSVAGDATLETHSLLTRPMLLDGPGRQAMRDSGIALDGWLTQTYGGIIDGDATGEWQYGGKGTAVATFDGEKLDLWRGFTAQLIQEWEYGESTDGLGAGTLLLANGIIAFPRVGGYDHDTSLTFTQQFGDRVSVSAGKFNLLHLVAKTPLVGGGAEETFLNAAVAGPITGVLPPYLVGAIANIETKPSKITLMVYDPRNAQDWDVVAHPFEESISGALTVTVPVRIAGRRGYYGIRGVVNNKEGLDLADIPSLVGLPPESQGNLTRTGYWYLNGSVQQYIYEDPNHPGAGWGLFGYASISDGNPNPIEWTMYVGLGGTNPRRHLDKWGAVYWKYGFSDDLLSGLSTVGIPREDEEGIEIFYNHSVTPWFQVTADAQWIDPFNSTRGDATIVTLRARTKF